MLMIPDSRRVVSVSLTLLLLVALAGSAIAQTPAQSVTLAKELAQLLDAKKLTTVAAKDGTDPESFVAAMYFSGSQLLVVGAKYQPPVLLMEKLAKKDYQEIYIDLNSAAKAGSRIFFEDLGADGLQQDHDEGKAFDQAEIGGKATRFSNVWRKDQKVSDEEWAKIFADADKVYARLLQALIVEAKK
jgi:hypothetical protein